MTGSRRAAAVSVAFLAVGTLALFVPACHSKNEGKIVGKWLATSDGPSETAVIYEFTEDGRFALGTAPSADGKTPGHEVMSGRYSLRSNNWVDVDVDSPPESRAKDREWIEVSGDTLTIVDNGQSQVFTRMK